MGKVKEIEAKHQVPPHWSSAPPENEVCEVCGTRTEAASSTNHARYACHFTGKVHVGYMKIRQWLKDLRTKQRDVETQECRRRGDDDRRRRRSRSKDEAREGRSRGGEADVRRRRSRSAARGGRRSRSRRRSRSGGRRQRSRSRDRRR